MPQFWFSSVCSSSPCGHRSHGSVRPRNLPANTGPNCEPASTRSRTNTHRTRLVGTYHPHLGERAFQRDLLQFGDRLPYKEARRLRTTLQSGRSDWPPDVAVFLGFRPEEVCLTAALFGRRVAVAIFATSCLVSAPLNWHNSFGPAPSPISTSRISFIFLTAPLSARAKARSSSSRFPMANHTGCALPHPLQTVSILAASFLAM